MDQFQLVSPYQPSGDQPAAIEGLVNGVDWGLREQTLLGVTGSGKTFTMIGSSVGGGEVEIVEINGTKTKSSGKFPSIIVNHIDRLGVISKISSILAHHEVNIVTMSNSREKKAGMATTMVETDHAIPLSVKEELEELDYIKQVVLVEKFA